MVKKPRPRVRPVHLETTIPVIRSCARCGVWLAAGVAEGMKAQVEFTALDLGQRVWAILQGIQLYAMRRSGLVHMDSTRMTDPRWTTMYPQHRCDIKWPVVTGVVQKRSRQDIPPY